MTEVVQPSRLTVDTAATDGVQQIRVHAATLTAFGRVIRRDFEVDVAPVANHVQMALANGAEIGANNPSVDLWAMLDAYQTCLDAMSRQLHAYANAAMILSESAHAIAARYATSDAMAEASTTTVTASLNSAISTVDTASAPPPGGAAI